MADREKNSGRESAKVIKINTTNIPKSQQHGIQSQSHPKFLHTFNRFYVLRHLGGFWQEEKPHHHQQTQTHMGWTGRTRSFTNTFALSGLLGCLCVFLGVVGNWLAWQWEVLVKGYNKTGFEIVDILFTAKTGSGVWEDVQVSPIFYWNHIKLIFLGIEKHHNILLEPSHQHRCSYGHEDVFLV